jgi:hypothetical protein
VSQKHRLYAFVLSLDSCFSCMRWRAASCFNAAFTLLCRFLRPLPRFGPSMGMGSARRCFRAACFSARIFSRFLSRFLSVLIDDLSNAPYAPRNLSNWPDVICVMKVLAVGSLWGEWECAHMCRDRHFLPVSCANDTWIFSIVIRRVHRYIIPIMSYCKIEIEIEELRRGRQSGQEHSRLLCVSHIVPCSFDD